MRLQNHKLSASVNQREGTGIGSEPSAVPPAAIGLARLGNQANSSRYRRAADTTLMVPHSRVSQVCNFNIMYGALPRLQTQ